VLLTPALWLGGGRIFLSGFLGSGSGLGRDGFPLGSVTPRAALLVAARARFSSGRAVSSSSRATVFRGEVLVPGGISPVVGFWPRRLVRRVLPGGWAGWWAGRKAFRVGGWGIAVCLRASGQRAPSPNVVNGLRILQSLNLIGGVARAKLAAGDARSRAAGTRTVQGRAERQTARIPFGAAIPQVLIRELGLAFHYKSTVDFPLSHN
jgi:hypothetical protein